VAKKLIITEKPSVARDIASALGKFTNHKEYLENETYVITWALGHLVGLAEPEDYDKKLKVWRLVLLPVIPEEFKLKVLEGNRDRLRVIQKLIKRQDVEALINACDAGREGELIFRYIYEFVKCKKPVFRLWLSSMTREAIREAFRNLRSGEEFANLAAAAKCRSEGDWLVGINGTRAFTARYRTLLSVGRVQTPTLAILVHREREIQEFVPTPYWEVFARFASPEGTYLGKWRNGEDRVYSQEEAQAIVERVRGGKGAVVEFEERQSSEAPPLLYDLTALQRDANKLLGFSAQRTLDAAQKLYESYKLITYPRTDSRFLSEDLMVVVEKSWSMLGDCGYRELVAGGLPRNALNNKRVFDKSKVTDHHAIIPTGEAIYWDTLSSDAQKIMDLIVKRFISVFYPDAKWAHRKIHTRVGEDLFVSKSKVLVEPGWRKVYGEKESEPQDFLPRLEEGEVVSVVETWFEAKETKAPPRYTEATLLAAMENAGKFVEDEELREVLKENGIGTPATRASIIERLIEVGYVEREGKTLIPTPKGMELINIVEAIPIEELASPQLTGEWERKLRLMEKGDYSRDVFMEEIKQLTVEIVEKLRNKEYQGELERIHVPIGSCPLCGAPVYENQKAFTCSRWKEGCQFVVWKTILGKKLTRTQVRKLLEEGKTEKLYGFRSRKSKKKFSAVLVLDSEGKISFEFPTSRKSSTKEE
jgi:DNA topoisomerase-3